MMTKRAEIRAPSRPLYSLPEAARAQITSRGSAVARSTLEELKFEVPKSSEDMIFLDFFRFFFVGDGLMEKKLCRMMRMKEREEG